MNYHELAGKYWIEPNSVWSAADLYWKLGQIILIGRANGTLSQEQDDDIAYDMGLLWREMTHDEQDKVNAALTRVKENHGIKEAL